MQGGRCRGRLCWRPAFDGQEGLWFVDRVEGGSSQYALMLAVHLRRDVADRRSPMSLRYA